VTLNEPRSGVVVARAHRYPMRMSARPVGVPMRREATRLQLLSKVGELAGILEYDEVLAAVARLSIPELADWSLVDVVEDGALRRAEVAHRDPARAALADHLRRLPSAAGYSGPTREALLSRRSLLFREYTDDVAREYCWSPAYVALARELRVRSFIVVPLIVRDSVVAVSTFVTTSESDRRYGEDDLALAEELARRAAGVVENAQLHHELKRSEQRFRVALAHTHVAVFEKDRDLRISWVYNPMFGEEPANLIGKAHPDTLRAEDAAALDAIQRAVLETGEPSREEVRFRIRGETGYLLAHLEPLRGPSGDVVGLTGALADVTEQKRAQEALAEALAFRERMLGILGHDLRNPLSAVRMLSTLLLRRDDLAEDAREQVAEIDRAGKRMLEMIETLLDFSEGRSKGALPVSPVPMDLHRVVRAVVDECLAANPGREIAVELHGDGLGRWDPSRMAQVVSNLVGNALTHGAWDKAVRVWVGGTANELRLVVHNGGSPIPPELMPEIFEPFRRGRRTAGASQARGLGLGLHIAKQIVTAHGGEIEVRSTAEDGTTFTVRVPRELGIEGLRHDGATLQ
jgi:PAS domain S-box-containing protein